ncbi:MAG: hypothetical protein ACR2IT_05220 [Pirellulales bacterium]
MGRHGRAVFAAVMACAVMRCAAAQGIPAFPGAEGAGAAAVGGRGGDVYFVTSLADTNTAGTLRYGISSAPTSGRTILFRTGGTIYLQSTLDINKPKVTIAGQSAPGGGITLAYRQTQVSGVNDVVIRNLRFRPGNSVTLASGTASPYEPDALHIEGVNNVIVDHVSASWSVDEVLSVTNSTNTTVQWSAITEALNNAGHSKGAHGYGALISGDVISYHHNYLAHNNSRNPRPGLSVSGNYVTGTINFDYRNNVNYDWGGENGYNGDEAGVMNMNYVGNYSVAGPSTSSSKTGRAFLVGRTDTRIYLSGNKIDANRDLVRNGTDTGWSMIATSTSTNPTRAGAPVGNTTFVSTQTADDAYASVMASAGAQYWNRDAIDTRVFGEPATQGGQIIDSGTQVGGYPTLVAGTPPLDTDSDGMPDAWERSLGLNPLVKNNNADFDADGYTDLEEYLNDLAAWPAPLPAVFSGSSARYAAWANWDTKWQPSRFDTAQINSGTATVDAIGQDAGTIQLAAAVVAGQSPTLAITAGGLRVTGNVIIGSATGSSGRLTLSGGTLLAGGTITTGSASSGVFTFTGGTLAAAAIDATKLKATAAGATGTFRVGGTGATIAPGGAGLAGRTAVTGGFAIDAGTLAIELGGTAAAAAFQSGSGYDAVVATGSVSLGGSLSLSLTGSYAPAWLVPHTIVSGGGVQGQFARIVGNDLGNGKRLAITYTANSAIVRAATAGDVNLDGIIDVLDVASFVSSGRFDSGNQSSWQQGDFNGDGLVDIIDSGDLIAAWSATQGRPYGAAGYVAVPEPSAAVAALMILPAFLPTLAVARGRRRRGARSSLELVPRSVSLR